MVNLDTIVYWLSYSDVIFATYLISVHFRSFFEGAHKFWASVAKGVGGWEAEGGRWQKLTKKRTE